MFSASLFLAGLGSQGGVLSVTFVSPGPRLLFYFLPVSMISRASYADKSE